MTDTDNFPQDWPQGLHPYTHHDPDHWHVWRFYPGRWLLDDGRQVSIDLWGVSEPAPLGDVLRRIDRILPLLDDRARQGLWQAIEDIYGLNTSTTAGEVEANLDAADRHQAANDNLRNRSEALAKAAELDRLGVPLDATRQQAAAALANAGLTVGRQAVLTQALQLRRDRAAAA